MEHSPWEANSSSASQEIPCIFWNPKIFYRIQKHPAPVPVLSQINPVRASPSYLLMINFNIILPSTPRSSQRQLSLYHLSCLPHVTHDLLKHNEFYSIRPVRFSIWNWIQQHRTKHVTPSTCLIFLLLFVNDTINHKRKASDRTPTAECVH